MKVNFLNNGMKENQESSIRKSKNIKYDLHHEDTPENLQYWMKEIPLTLKIIFKMENFSNNELFIIKRITQDVLRRFNTIDKDIKSDDGYPIDKEIMTRFLTEAYGIDVDYIDKNTETEEDREAFIEFIRRTREKAHLI